MQSFSPVSPELKLYGCSISLQNVWPSALKGATISLMGPRPSQVSRFSAMFPQQFHASISGPLPADLYKCDVRHFYVKGSESENPYRVSSGTLIWG